MVKIADSATIRQAIPTFPRYGSTHGADVEINGVPLALIARTFHSYRLSGSSGCLRSHNGRRLPTHRPFERPGIPGIVSGFRALPIRINKIHYEQKRGDALNECANRGNEIPYFPAAAGLVRINAARHAKYTGNVHPVEGEVKPDEEQPEMQLTQAFAQHPSRHFWEPVIEGGKKTKQNSADDHVGKVRDDKIGVPQLPIEGRGGQHDAGQAGD